MKRIVGIAAGSAALAAAFTGGAWADGIPARRAPVAAPAVVEDRCGWGPWTGFYVGGNLGAAWNQNDFRDRDRLFDRDFDHGRATLNHTETSFTGGVQAGYNYQCKNFVIGFETDFNGLTHNNEDRHVFRDYWGDPNDFRRKDNSSWFGTIRGRLGWTDNTFLVYATGGAAYSDRNMEIRGTDFWDNDHRFNDNVNWGWTAGGGVEYLHSQNITLRVEALWMDFTNNEHTERANVWDGERWREERFRLEREDQLWTVRFGVNYLFGGREPEVVPLK